jgi:signal transduction histidine kinase/ActR/RegA family two-component response regulator
LLGYRAEEIVRQHYARFYTPEDRENGVPEDELQRALEYGRALDERWHVRKDDTRLWGSGVITPLALGALPGFAVVMSDRTQQKLAQDALQASEAHYRRLAAELEELNRRKDKFLATLAHEILNPLSPIANAVQILQLDASANPTQVRARNIIERQTQQLARLVDDLLDASRITAGKLHLRKERLDLGMMAKKAIEGSCSLIQACRHKLMLSLPPHPVWLDADPARLEQILLNLLNNAAKFTPKGGRIWLHLEVDGDRAELRVRDTGQGIMPEMLPHIFDLFTQAEQKALDRSTGGLGIGLALVRSLAEMHGGTIEARSEGPGLGAEFILRLPLSSAPELPQPDSRPSGTDRDRPLRILLVEDNADAASALAMLLRSCDYDVREAHSGEQALKAVPVYRPDVALLDIGLPGMDGYEVAKHLREIPEARGIFIVGVSCYGQEIHRQRAFEAGFDNYYRKPLAWERLEEQLRMLAERPRDEPPR